MTRANSCKGRENGCKERVNSCKERENGCAEQELTCANLGDQLESGQRIIKVQQPRMKVERGVSKRVTYKIGEKSALDDDRAFMPQANL